ncbi:MAG TPA: EAL domain-containing protein [Methylophilaceae bacterium]|jgi:diguanylate cyclase (GGDEF)-like protein/PAS domain S-box-containing protein
MAVNKNRLLGRLLIVTLAYLVTGKLGLLIPYVGSHITLIWLPTGIAVAALMRWGYVTWPAVFAGAFLVNLSVGSSLLLAGGLAVGNTLGPLFAAWLLQKFKFNIFLMGVHDILLMTTAACLGMTISATSGVTNLVLNGVLDIEHVMEAWLVWWAGDTVGVILVLPVLLTISKSELRNLWQQRTKYILWCAIVSVLEWVIFQQFHHVSGQFMLLAFVVLPLVIWSTMRFGLAGSSLAVLGLSIIAVFATASGQGPFYTPGIHQGVFSLWVFMSILALVALMISVLQIEREVTERALRVSEAQLRAVIDGALDAIVTVNETGHLIEFNPAAERIFGFRRDQVIGRPLVEVIIPPALRAAHTKGHQLFVQTGKKHIFDQRLELTAVRSDGSEFPVELTITSLREKGLPLVTGFIRDITDRKKAEEEIRNLAFFDALTSLPNRRLLLDRLQQALVTSARTQSYGAVLFIDLDNFKTLNDSRGHEMGDLLLIEVANRLRRCVRAEDTVSRLGGDEFVVILEDLSEDPEQALAQVGVIGEKILNAINEPYLLRETEHHNTSSIGISLFSGRDVVVDELLKRSDTAMYQAKAAGRNTLRFFDPAMQASLEKRIRLESQLRFALAQQQLRIYYQVQVDVSRHVFGAEALLRWEHPQHGLMMPTEFIAVAEDSGLIIPIGYWVLQQACQQLKRWEADDHCRHIQLAVNVSARRFRQPDFVDEIKQHIQISGANPTLLKLELTESVVLDNIPDTVEKMHALRELGVQFAMDDFGTGYSSLAYLKQLPLTQVKIDQSFVRDIAIDPNDAAIVQAIIGMSSTLSLSVIAEGVETEQQLELLKQYGCEQFQGYLFSKPVPVEALEKILHEDRLLFVNDSGENSRLT